MNLIKFFQEFINDGVVKTQSPDNSRAHFLMKESTNNYEVLQNIIKDIGINDKSANTLIKLCYDILMELVRAEMLSKGYNATGQGAHEAEVSYLRELGFKENDVQFADQLRYFRNRMMYYGKILDAEYARKALDFLKRMYAILTEMHGQK